MPDRTRHGLPAIIRPALILGISVVMLLPLAWMVTVSLRQPGQPLPLELDWLPSPIAWDNYREVFRQIDYGVFIANSLLISTTAMFLNTLIASMSGFAIARSGSRARRILIALCFVAMMVPLTAIWLPRFILVKELGLIDSRLSLLLPAMMGTSPFFVLIWVWTFLRLPNELFESAQLDNAGPFRIWLGIALPVCRPTTIAVAVLSFLWYWRDFIEPLLYIQSMSKMTLPLGLKALQQLDRSNWPILMAASVIFVGPAIALFLLAQRWILQQNRGEGWLGR